MKDYEKLILFLEMQNMDVSPFLKLKKNELAIKGAFDIFDVNSYKELLSLDLNNEAFQHNAYFMSLGKRKYSKKISDFKIIHHKTGEVIKIQDIYNDESLTEQERHELVFKGVERANFEYKRFMSYLMINHQTVLKDYSKLIDEDKRNNKRNKLVKKHIKFYMILAILLVVIDLLFLQNSYFKQKQTFVIIYNGLIFFLLSISVFKKIYLNFFSHRVSKNQQRINQFHTTCERILDLNDRNFEHLEKDLYRYSHDTQQNKRILYLQKTNIKLKKLNQKAEVIFKKNQSQIRETLFIILMRLIHFVPILGLILLIVLAIF